MSAKQWQSQWHRSLLRRQNPPTTKPLPPHIPRHEWFPHHAHVTYRAPRFRRRLGIPTSGCASRDKSRSEIVLDATIIDTTRWLRKSTTSYSPFLTSSTKKTSSRRRPITWPITHQKRKRSTNCKIQCSTCDVNWKSKLLDLGQRSGRADLATPSVSRGPISMSSRQKPRWARYWFRKRTTRFWQTPHGRLDDLQPYFGNK